MYTEPVHLGTCCKHIKPVTVQHLVSKELLKTLFELLIFVVVYFVKHKTLECQDFITGRN